MSTKSSFKCLENQDKSTENRRFIKLESVFGNEYTELISTDGNSRVKEFNDEYVTFWHGLERGFYWAAHTLQLYVCRQIGAVFISFDRKLEWLVWHEQTRQRASIYRCSSAFCINRRRVAIFIFEKVLTILMKNLHSIIRITPVNVYAPAQIQRIFAHRVTVRQVMLHWPANISKIPDFLRHVYIYRQFASFSEQPFDYRHVM